MVTGGVRTERSNRYISLKEELASGGEGTIWTVADDENTVVKLYQMPTIERAHKLAAMLENPPSDPSLRQGHRSIAWPTDRVMDSEGQCVGFVMPRLDIMAIKPLHQSYRPKDRQTVAPHFTFRHLIRTLCNLASVMEAMHIGGYVIGDLNESNVLVTGTALVSLVDCDSIQVRGLGSHVFRCIVGKPEYTAPELIGQDLASVDRTPAHDSFAFGVLAFLTLMQGHHPYGGKWKGTGDPPSLVDKIRTGNSAYFGSTMLSVPPGAPRYDVVLPSIRKLFESCFVEGLSKPTSRPSASEWHRCLLKADEELVICSANHLHCYGRHLSACPWCSHTFDFFPQPPLGTVPISPSKPAKKATCRVFAIANQKGCTGKTTTVVNLGACLADAGRKVLIVDLSPGSDLTMSLGVDSHKVHLSMYDLLVRNDVHVGDIMLNPEGRTNLYLLPAKVDLYDTELEFPFLGGREYRLDKALVAVKDSFDFILIDCPSWLGLLTINALAAADGVILPLQCEYSALEGMQYLLKTIHLVRERLNPRIGLFGVVLTMYDPRTKLGAEVVREVAEHFPREKFQQTIPRNVRLAEARSFGQTVLEHDPRGVGELAYKALAEEVIARAATMEALHR